MGVRGYLLGAMWLLLGCAGCTAPTQVEMVAVEPFGWSESRSVIVNNDDTLSLRRIAVALRYNSDFEGETLPLRIVTSSPNALYVEEQVTLPIARPYSASVVAVTEEITYRHSARLSQRGNYIFTITPLETVKGVEAVGVILQNE